MKAFILLLTAALSLFCASLPNAFGQGLEFTRPGRKSFSMSFKLNSNLMLIPMRINGSAPMRFIMDSGVQSCILTELATGDELSLSYARRVSLRGLGKGAEIEALQSVGNSFLIEETIHGRRQFMFVMLKDIFHLSSKLGEQVHGLVGYPLFNSFIVRINYRKKQVRFYDPDYYKRKIRKRDIRLPLEIQETKAYVQLKVVQDTGDTTAVKLLLDTGASHALWLNADSDPDLHVPEVSQERFLGRGLNGDIYGSMGRVQALLIGDKVLSEPLVAFPDSASAQDVFGVGERNGALGAEVLRRFHVTIDYPNKQLILRPNADFNKPFEYNMSGLEVVNPLPGYPFFEIAEVQKGSPAAAAGLQVGDQIMQVNGKEVDELQMSDLNALFQSRPGKLIRMMISREGKRVTTQFILRREI